MVKVVASAFCRPSLIALNLWRWSYFGECDRLQMLQLSSYRKVGLFELAGKLIC